MKSKICVMTIFFLSLDNVSGLICGSLFSRNPSSQWQRPSQDKPAVINDLEGSQGSTDSCPKSYQQWYQGYRSGRRPIAIGNIPPQERVKRTGFIIKVEEFDNNTELYYVNSTLKKKILHVSQIPVIAKVDSYVTFDTYSEFYKALIKIEANETRKQNEELTILKYNEKKNVSFSCLEHIIKTTYIQLSLINTTSNMIETFEANSMHTILNITLNGTILCCVYYVVTVNETTAENWITRYVSNKTLLLYNEIIEQVHLGGNEISNIISAGSAADGGHQTLIIISITTVAVVFILLVIIVICKKRSRKKPESDSKVLYADLDILREVQPDSFPRSGPEEECPYAQIIGEIRHQNK